MLQEHAPEYVGKTRKDLVMWGHNAIEHNLIEESGLSVQDWVAQFAERFAQVTSEPDIQELFASGNLRSAKELILERAPELASRTN